MNFRVSEEVAKALEENKPVIALESTIISHGMPYPQNVETAMKVESIIREHGCIPATVGIVDGFLWCCGGMCGMLCISYKIWPFIWLLFCFNV